ncbi:Molybdopterin-binding domain of aldehyde dehydrogenase-domain-containing protein [Gaertneriomyces semiglobifer]|nr:Molybdopterin-binding domain of aldehyde dehydrogenase-domain-containing protein [Gaertneriomyces semiglobifer]
MLSAKVPPEDILPERRKLQCYINGKPFSDFPPDPQETLIAFLRRHGLTGTKLGCGEGGCGSCTVMLSSYNDREGRVDHNSVNACLALACSIEGKHVVTIEGLGTSTNPHPTQEAIAYSHGSQCGFCTPGIVMSLYTLTQNNQKPSPHDIEEAFDGNLCRCTGYRPIIEGAQQFSVPHPPACNGHATSHACQSQPNGDANGHGTSHACQSQPNGDANGHAHACNGNINGSHEDEDDHCAVGCSKSECTTKKANGTCSVMNGTADIEDMKPRRALDPSRDLPFPPALKQVAASYMFRHDNGAWYHPTTLEELKTIMDANPKAKIVTGNTEIGIEVRMKGADFPTMVNASDVREITSYEESDDGIWMGAGVTLKKFQDYLESFIASYESHKTENMKACLDNLKYFAGPQIRNVASIAGNIVTASAISDLNPVFVAIDAVLKVSSVKGGSRTIPMKEFFVGYRRTALKPSEVVESVFIPFTQKGEYTLAFKQSKRKHDDIAIVNSCMRVRLDENNVVQDAALGFGGLSAFTRIATEASKRLVGLKWERDIVDGLGETIISKDFVMSSSTPGGQVAYRRQLALSFLRKFYLYVAGKINAAEVKPEEQSALTEIERGLARGTQFYEQDVRPLEGSEKVLEGAVGTSIPHLAALKQVTGEAVYIDDIPKYANECYAGLVQSAEANAAIESVDPSEALAMEGVLGYVGAEDIPNFTHEDAEHGPNMIGPIFHDEELFATKRVHYVGQMIGLVVATSETVARKAARMVKVVYTDKRPVIVTIEDAIEANSFFNITKTISSGCYDPLKREADVPLEAATHSVTGVARMSAQEHFYLETQASLVVPKREDNEIEIFASTQHPSETQQYVARVLGIPSNRVNCRVKRMGGGFGGKESRSVPLACALAVAAHKLHVPVRCMYTREEDMAVSGQRHPFRGDYKIGFTDEGKIVYLEVDLINNAGFSADLSSSVMERAVSHVDNCYRIPNMKVTGRLAKTNIASNTAFRGFGGPQGLMIAEQYITHIAEYLGKSVEEIRRINLYKMGELTHFRQPLEDVFMERLWDELVVSSEFKRRQQEVKEFNAKHKYRKRGIALMPTKFGLAFTARWLNQAGALVHVYTDGSVLITHGGTEMGQGLHTKMVQVAAQALGIPISKVHLSETQTATVPNTSATAASVSSDLNGMAVLDACTKIRERLQPYEKIEPPLTWEQMIQKAYFDRVSLSATGFYKTPDLSYDWATNDGRMFNYFTYGAACAEVEVDTLTGDHTCLRADIVMDIGKSINPALDIGQIEGAFVQGMGWATLEEPLLNPNTGFLITRGPGNYKIPGFRDIPVDFRVSFLSGVANKRAIHSSKAVGEPPLFLGASVFFALREAIKSARAEYGEAGYFRMDSPATSERILLACGGKDTALAKDFAIDGKPWAVPA